MCKRYLKFSRLKKLEIIKSILFSKIQILKCFIIKFGLKVMSLRNLIGNTPMIKINYEYNGNLKAIYTKLEFYNLTGSIKDRVAFYINFCKKMDVFLLNRLLMRF